MFLKVGQTIKLNRRIEIELSSGWTAVLEAGEEMTVTDIAAVNEDGSVQAEISAKDVPMINPWDRSGQSDDEGDITAYVMDISPDDLED
jgi:hypothetical protein